MSDIEEMGAIDWFLIAAQDKEINGELIPPLLDLVDRRLIRIIDVLIIVKRDEGDFDALTTVGSRHRTSRRPRRPGGRVVGILSSDDAAEAAALMQPNSIGLMIVYENLWSAAFAVAARRAGGQLWPRATSPPRPSWPHSTPSSPDQKELVMPGLIRGVARTAVVAGTATAVSNRVSRRQANRWSQNDQSAYAQPQYAEPQYAQPQYAQPQYAQPQYVAPAPPPPAAAPPAADMFEQLKQLAELRDQGILTDEEFAVQKARILAT